MVIIKIPKNNGIENMNSRNDILKPFKNPIGFIVLSLIIKPNTMDIAVIKTSNKYAL